jgi:hypothetical protein
MLGNWFEWYMGPNLVDIFYFSCLDYALNMKPT